MHFSLWRRCGAMLFLVAVLIPLSTQATNRVASLIAYGRSITMKQATTRIPGVSDESMSFATYDGTNTFPLHTKNSQPFDYNGEVRPRSGQNGVYETDYLFLLDGFAHEWGTLTFTLPTADVDTNGVPDFLQSDRAVNAALTGSGTIHAKDGFIPGSTNTAITLSNGQFTRGENELTGDYSFSMNTIGRSAITTEGKWILWQLSGSAFYERQTKNKLSLGLVLTNGNGASLSYTGSTTYVVSNSSQLMLPAMTLRRSDGNNITLAAMTLTRSGKRYSGVATLSDGTLGTPWADFNTFNFNITDDHDADTNGIPDLTDISEAPDTKAPKVAFTVPSAFAKVTNAVLTVHGTASDEVGLKRVEVQYGTNAPQSLGTSNFWSARVNLDIGTNQILAHAYDYRGHTSTVSRYFVRLPISPLNLTWTPGGTVTPNLNSNVIIVGQRYTLTAKPSSKFLFAGWTGGVATNVAKLTFTMVSNLVLQANFVTNDFLGVKGTYQGLFDDTNAPAHETAGFLKATVSDKGGYSGSLKQGTKTYSFSGQFELDGKSTNRIKFQKTNTLVAVLCLDLTNGLNQMVGTLASSNLNARILATRPIYKSGVSNAPFAGRYTMNFASTLAPANPPGFGVLTVVADNAGTSTIAGKLGEGTATSQKVPASHDGLVPYYQSLTSGRGSIFGWLRFTNAGPDTLAGSLLWTKPSSPKDKLYRDGFTNHTEAFGSTYSSALLATSISNATSIEAQITGLTSDTITNSLIMSAKNTFTSTNGLKLKLDLKTGLWTGTFPEPTTRKALPVNATLLEQRGNGGGYALGTNASAAVTLLLQ
jgi:Divergent InlB B-repeat domain/Bacterial Ig domain